MKKKNNALLGGLLFLAIVALAVSSAKAVPTPGQKDLKPFIVHKINAVFSVSVNNLNGAVDVIGPGGQHVADAIVMMNKKRLTYMNAYGYYMGSSSEGGIGTQVVLKVWLMSKIQGPFLPGNKPDYEGKGSASNWLTPVFPNYGSTVDLSQSPSPTFQWAFAGATEKTCLRLEAQPAGTTLHTHCGVQTAHTIPAGILTPNSHYKLYFENYFPFHFSATASPAADSSVSFQQETFVSFPTI